MKSFFKSSFLLVGCLIFLALGCEDLDLKGEAAGEVQGLWQLYEGTGTNTFLSISEVKVIYYYYDGLENCIKIEEYDVVRVDEGGFYILTQEGLEENKVLAISKNGDRIHVRDINETQSSIDKFFPSIVDIATLAPVCINPEDVYGQWELIVENEPPVYLSITQDSIKVIDSVPEQECFLISELEILEINGNVFTLSNNDPNSSTGTQEVKITRTQEGIEVEREEDGEIITEIFSTSTADFSTFTTICDPNFTGDFIGQWQFNAPSDDDSEIYLIIKDTQLSYHTRIDDPLNNSDDICFEIDTYNVVEFGFGSISLKETIEPFGEITLLLDFRESENLLYVDDGVDIVPFFSNTINEEYINNQCTSTATN